MYYLLQFKKGNQWNIYRVNNKIQIYKSEDQAKDLIQKNSNTKFRIKSISIHPKQRGSPLWKKRWEEVS